MSRGFTIMLHQDGALHSRQLRVPRWAMRIVIGGTVLLATGLVLLAALYGPTVSAAARVPFLVRENARLKAENARVVDLARRLDEIEANYAHLRGLLGADMPVPELRPDSSRQRAAADERLYVAPALIARAPSAADSLTPGPSIPHRWPLTAASFRTRGLAENDPDRESHFGLDLAVPVGSNVRASGGGMVRTTGADSAYGMYITLTHPDGYETRYAHLSRFLVARGDSVRAGQIIALSGNTGRSTAPHLHFEVRRNGRSVDPTQLVREGR